MSAFLEGFLELRNPDGGCVELFNNCRTLHYAANGPAIFDVNTDCETCCCPHHDAGYGPTPATGPNIAPWYSAALPASASFLGLYGSLSIGQVTGNGGRAQRRITFQGAMLATCKEGLAFGDQWIRGSVLEPFCGACRGQQATVFRFCGDDFDPAEPPVYPNPRPELVRDCCNDDGTVHEPDILEAAPNAPALADSGRRRILRVSYVLDSFQVTPSDLIECYACEVSFSFDVETGFITSDAVPVCDLGFNEDTQTDEAIFDEDYCRPLVIDTTGDPDDCGRCGFPCRCDTTIADRTTENTGATVFSTVDYGCRWSTPLCATRVTCITPRLPYELAVPIIAIEAGPTDIELLVTMWDAHPGLPDPATCLGDDIYCGRDPVVEPAQLHIPAGTTMIMDGRTGRTELLCDTRIAAGALATTASGTRLSLPVVRCQRRLWIAFDADCYNLPALGTRITVEMAGRYKV